MGVKGQPSTQKGTTGATTLCRTACLHAQACQLPAGSRYSCSLRAEGVCLGGRFLCRHLLSVGAPRTARRPVRCRLTSRRLSQQEGSQAGTDALSVGDLQRASSELDRRRSDPAFHHREVQVTVRLDTVSKEHAGWCNSLSPPASNRTGHVCRMLQVWLHSNTLTSPPRHWLGAMTCSATTFEPRGHPCMPACSCCCEYSTTMSRAHTATTCMPTHTSSVWAFQLSSLHSAVPCKCRTTVRP